MDERFFVAGGALGADAAEISLGVAVFAFDEGMSISQWKVGHIVVKTGQSRLTGIIIAPFVVGMADGAFVDVFHPSVRSGSGSDLICDIGVTVFTQGGLSFGSQRLVTKPALAFEFSVRGKILKGDLRFGLRSQRTGIEYLSAIQPGCDSKPHQQDHGHDSGERGDNGRPFGGRVWQPWRILLDWLNENVTFLVVFGLKK